MVDIYLVAIPLALSALPSHATMTALHNKLESIYDARQGLDPDPTEPRIPRLLGFGLGLVGPDPRITGHRGIRTLESQVIAGSEP
jgi:hypothetical protein